jgi:hypothetical protein
MREGWLRRDAMGEQQEREKRGTKERRTVGSRSNYSDGPHVCIARASGALWTVWRRTWAVGSGQPSGGVAWAATARMPETSLTLLSSSDGDANGHRRLSAATGSLPRATLAVIGQIADKSAAPMADQGLPACGEAFGASRWHFTDISYPPTTTKTCPRSLASAQL